MPLLVSALVTAGCANDPCSGGELICRWSLHDEADPPLSVVTYGTSLTADGSWVDAVSTELEARYPGAATWVNSAEGARYSVWGLENFEERVVAHAPDVLFIEFAVNDAFLPYETSVASSRANLETMLDRIEETMPEVSVVVVITNHVIGPGAEMRPELLEYYDEWRAIGVERGALVVDEQVVWERLLERSPAVFDVLVPDGLHPSYDGHDRVNRPLILDALDGVVTDTERLLDGVIAATPLP